MKDVLVKIRQLAQDEAQCLLKEGGQDLMAKSQQISAACLQLADALSTELQVDPEFKTYCLGQFVHLLPFKIVDLLGPDPGEELTSRLPEAYLVELLAKNVSSCTSRACSSSWTCVLPSQKLWGRQWI